MVFEDILHETKERFGLNVNFPTIDSRMTQAVNDNINNILQEVDQHIPFYPFKDSDMVVFHYMTDLESVLWFYRYPPERLTQYIKNKMEMTISPSKSRFRFDTYRYLSTIFSSLAAHSMLMGATFAYARMRPSLSRSEIVIELQDVEMGCHLLFTNESRKSKWLC